MSQPRSNFGLGVQVEVLIFSSFCLLARKRFGLLDSEVTPVRRVCRSFLRRLELVIDSISLSLFLSVSFSLSLYFSLFLSRSLALCRTRVLLTEGTPR